MDRAVLLDWVLPGESPLMDLRRHRFPQGVNSEANLNMRYIQCVESHRMSNMTKRARLGGAPRFGLAARSLDQDSFQLVPKVAANRLNRILCRGF